MLKKLNLYKMNSDKQFKHKCNMFFDDFIKSLYRNKKITNTFLNDFIDIKTGTGFDFMKCEQYSKISHGITPLEI